MKWYLKLMLFSITGSVLGYSYYYFAGCSNGGTCPLTSRWYITTIYGFIAGILMAFPVKRGKGQSVNIDNNIEKK